jgi:hypothetical protein
MTRRAPDRDAGAIALGFRVKSGRAIAVAMSGSPAAPAIVLRSEVALCDDRVAATRQPYHDGFGTAQADQQEIARLSAIVERCAQTSIASLLEADGIAGHACRGAALVVGSVIDPAAVANPHIRAHANEGRLFRTVVERALEQHGLAVEVIVEKELAARAAHVLQRTDAQIKRIVAAFGEAVGGPWRADEKAAAIAAWMALKT